jgi:serine phosphatase RsbU (regulator of sigma subunit)
MKLDSAVHIRSYPGIPRGGDTGVVVPDEDGVLAALVDASGHGLTAYAVAQIARRTLLQTSSREPDAIL